MIVFTKPNILVLRIITFTIPILPVSIFFYTEETDKNKTRANMVLENGSQKKSFLLKYFELDPEEANMSFQERWRFRQEKQKQDGSGTCVPMVMMSLQILIF